MPRLSDGVERAALSKNLASTVIILFLMHTAITILDKHFSFEKHQVLNFLSLRSCVCRQKKIVGNGVM